MKNWTKLSLTLLMLCSSILLHSQQVGSLVIENINAPSMANSLIGEPQIQPIAVYLPPSYNIETEKRYPVVYFLPGYEDTLNAYIKGYIGGYFFEKSMNSNITQGRLKEVIMVIVNGYNLLEGSFFNNSPITGNWEDFVVQDVVNYMDAKYRTIPTANSRALMGLSMGGFGALRLSMKYPSVFSIGIGQCPGLAKPGGLMKTTLFSDVSVINRIISIRNDLSKLQKEEAHKKYLDTIIYFKKHQDWITLFSFAYGSAFAPNTNINAPYFDYPFSKDANNKLVMDSAIYNTYDVGFGNLKNKVETYKDSLLKLKGYAIDYGTNDFFQWIPEGSIYYDGLLTEAGIPHKLWKNSGGHGDLLKSRTETVELPYCDSILTFDTEHLSNKTAIEKFTCSGQDADPIIDPVNKRITISFKSGTKLTAVKPSIYASPGAKFSPAQGTAVDLTSGSIVYTVTSEDGQNTETWTVNASINTSIEEQSNRTNSIQVFPNPAFHSFSLTANQQLITKVELIDMYGRTNYSKTTNSEEVKVEKHNLLSGTYFVKAYTKNDCFMGKVILK